MAHQQNPKNLKPASSLKDTLLEEDTIAAIATAVGEAGVAIIRLSGPDAAKIASKIYRGKKSVSEFSSHRLYYGQIFDGEKLLDQVLACFMKAPHSYTGEDVVEIHLHCSPYLAMKVLKTLITRGARLAQPGEFTKRAFLNGKMDLAQAEAVLDIVQSQANASVEVAQAQRQGRLSGQVERLREGLTEVLTELEAAIDFPEEDVGVPDKEILKEKIRGERSRIRQMIETYEEGFLYRTGLLVPILGRTNVGKSSLFNALLGSERSIVTGEPGTTRDLIDDIVRLEGLAIRLQDTAGVGKRQEVEKAEELGVGRSRDAAQRAQVAIFVIDGSEGLTEEDLKTFKELVDKKKAVIAINKIDLGLAQGIREDLKERFPTLPLAQVSALEGTGLGDLKSLLINQIRHDRISEGQVVITHLRHREALDDAELSLAEALKSLDKGLSEEFAAADLQAALLHLGEITGLVTSEDILNRIFSQFCIGK